MKTTITKLYDYHTAQIPKELRVWRIGDEEIEEQLKTLSRDHAFEQDVDSVQLGDSVACRGESDAERWNRPVLLFYPGRGICEAELENACLGAKLGETRTVTVGDAVLKLTVTRIVRRSDMPIGDELIRAENIPGVSTVEAYRRWYRETNEPTRRLHAAYRLASYLSEEVAEQSELAIDEEEKNGFVWDWVNRMYDAMLDAGVDPTIPKEGFDFLTEEEAKQGMFDQFEPSFRLYVTNLALAEQLTGRDAEELCRERLQKVAEENQTTPEAILRQSGTSMTYGRMINDTLLDALSKYTDGLLED